MARRPGVLSSETDVASLFVLHFSIGGGRAAMYAAAVMENLAYASAPRRFWPF
jgi:hypothetical protein